MNRQIEKYFSFFILLIFLYQTELALSEKETLYYKYNNIYLLGYENESRITYIIDIQDKGSININDIDLIEEKINEIERTDIIEGNEGKANDSGSVYVTDSKNISLNISVSPAGAGVGDKITYYFVVKNTGNRSLSNLHIHDNYLGNITPRDTYLEPNYTATVSVDYIISLGDMPGPLVNIAIVIGEDNLGREVRSELTTSVYYFPAKEMFSNELPNNITVNNSGQSIQIVSIGDASVSNLSQRSDIESVAQPAIVHYDVSIDSDPRGAWIWLDGINKSSKTPKNLVVQYPGNHEIELEKSGYYSKKILCEIKYGMPPLYFKLEKRMDNEHE